MVEKERRQITEHVGSGALWQGSSPHSAGVFLYLDMNQVKKMSEFLKFLIYNKNLR